MKAPWATWQLSFGSPCLHGHETTLTGESQLTGCKSRLGFIPFGQQSGLWQSKCSSQIPKSFSFYWNSVVLWGGDRVGRRSWVYSSSVGWEHASLTHGKRSLPPSTLGNTAHGLRVQRQGRRGWKECMAKVQACGLAGCPFIQEQVMWPGPSLCLLLGHFPPALPIIAVLSHASRCTAMEKTEKQLSGRENHCEGWWWPLWKSFWTWQVFKLIFKHLFYTPTHVLTFNINCSFGCSLKQREEK